MPGLTIPELQQVYVTEATLVELLQGDVAEWRALFTSAGTEGMS